MPTIGWAPQILKIPLVISYSRIVTTGPLERPGPQIFVYSFACIKPLRSAIPAISTYLRGEFEVAVAATND